MYANILQIARKSNFWFQREYQCIFSHFHMNKSDFTKSLELNEFCGIILFEIQHKRDENKERKKTLFNGSSAL